MLYVRNFVKRYGPTTVLEIPSLSFSPGIYWIKGENGSGKSTFFKSLAGILPHDGEISFRDGTDQRKDPIRFRQLVNFSEAEPLFPGFLSAKDIIRFAGKTKGASIAQQDNIAATMGVSSFIHQSCETFSSGMLKKLSLTLAFLGQPQMIILDEPLITLDEEARNALWTLVEDHVRQDIIFLISSHQMLDSPQVQINGSYRIDQKKLVPC